MNFQNQWNSSKANKNEYLRVSMKKQAQYDRAYLEMAQTWGELSYCKRKKWAL